MSAPPYHPDDPPNPSTQEVVAAARAAFRHWRALPLAERARRLEPLLESLPGSTLAAQMVDEIGKPITQAKAEVARAGTLVRSALREVRSTPLERAAPDGTLVVQRPVGVVAVVTPWNNPVAIPVGKIVPALLYGNAVVWKPAPAATAIAATLHALLGALGLPVGLVGFLPGERQTTLALIADDVDAVTLSGGPRAGDAVRLAVAARPTPVQLQAELGGNNGAIVWSDIDVADAAKKIADGALKFAGQRCTANRRAIVHRPAHAAFVAALEREVAALTWGDPRDPATQIGPVVSAESRDRVLAIIDRARAAGATILQPHARPPDIAGAWAPPTIAIVTDPACEIAREETFGPVIVVLAADDEDHALALVNGVRQGLVAALFGGSEAFRARFLAEAEAGTVKLDRPTTDAGTEAPFGGWKASGIGPPEHERGNREFFSRTQSVVVPPGLAAVARRQPDRPAVVIDHPDGARVTTYAELDRLASRLARLMAGASPGERVATLFAPGPEAIAVAEAAARAGVIAVPLEPTEPPERLSAMLADAGCRAVIAPTDPELGVPWIDAAAAPPAAARLRPGGPEAASLILYTSGSTGRPKGVVQARATYLRTARGFIQSLDVRPGDRVALVASSTTGQGMATITTALESGAALVLYDLRARGASDLPAFVERQRVSLWMSTPTAFRLLFRALPAGRTLPLRAVRVGGEAVTASDVALFRAHTSPGARFFHTYSSTEAGALTQLVVGPDDVVPAVLPVGAPFTGRDVFIVDDALRPMPAGQVGRIAVRSRDIALGYWNDAARTADSFREIAGERWFLSADRGRFVDGVLEHLGRDDREVKHHGVRVDLGEIEAALSCHPAVTAAVATIIDGGPGAPARLAAWVTPASAPLEALRDHLRTRLAAAAMPALAATDRLPLTANGKLDVRALPTPAEPAETPPTNDLERVVAERFAAALGLERCGRERDYFRSGGQSLPALALLDELNRLFATALVPDDLIAHPTVASLAARIARTRVDPTPGLLRRVSRPSESRSERPMIVYFPGGADHVPSVVSLFAPRLAPRLGDDLDFYVITPAVLRAPDVETMARRLVDELKTNPDAARGVTLVGMCLGGLIAWETARQLRDAGLRVASLVLVDTGLPRAERHDMRRIHYGVVRLDRDFANFIARRVGHHWRALVSRTWPERVTYLASPLAAAARLGRRAVARDGRNPAHEVIVDYHGALMRYRPAPLPIPVTLIECDDRRVGGWERLAALDVRKIAASHAAMFQEPQMTTLVEALREVLP